jgi:hypothetical protein
MDPASRSALGTVDSLGGSLRLHLQRVGKSARARVSGGGSWTFQFRPSSGYRGRLCRHRLGGARRRAGSPGLGPQRGFDAHPSPHQFSGIPGAGIGVDSGTPRRPRQCALGGRSRGIAPDPAVDGTRWRWRGIGCRPHGRFPHQGWCRWCGWGREFRRWIGSRCGESRGGSASSVGARQLRAVIAGVGWPLGRPCFPPAGGFSGALGESHESGPVGRPDQGSPGVSGVERRRDS